MKVPAFRRLIRTPGRQLVAGSGSSWPEEESSEERATRYGLVSVYLLDNLNDSYGTNHLTNNNVATFGTGKLGSAVTFIAASAQFLSCADNASLSMGDNDWMITAWVKLSAATANYGLICKRAVAAEYEFDLYLDTTGADKFRLYVENAGATADVEALTMPSPSSGTWYFLAFYNDSVNNQIGISGNGGAFDTLPLVGGSRDTDGPLLLGTDNDNHSNASLDAVHIFKSPPGGLAAVRDEIRDYLHNSGAGREYPWT